MTKDEMFHDWLVSYLEKRLSGDYKEIKANYSGEQQHDYQGQYPDLILGNQGMVVALMQVETEASISPERAERWKELAGTGVKVTLMVPGHLKSKVMDLVWKNQLVNKVGVASYDISIRM
jgi:hypothetical protein